VPGGRLPAPPSTPPGWRRVRRLLVADRVDPRCVALLAEHPVMLTERISGERGATVRRQVIDGLRHAAQDLAGFGVDTRPLLASVAAETALLRRLRTDATRSEGHRRGGLVLVLAAGQGTGRLPRP
jgi:hypothetical protein